MACRLTYWKRGPNGGRRRRVERDVVRRELGPLRFDALRAEACRRGTAGRPAMDLRWYYARKT
jgi:hypothetical protein